MLRHFCRRASRWSGGNDRNQRYLLRIRSCSAGESFRNSEYLLRMASRCSGDIFFQRWYRSRASRRSSLLMLPHFSAPRRSRCCFSGDNEGHRSSNGWSACCSSGGKFFHGVPWASLQAGEATKIQANRTTPRRNLFIGPFLDRFNSCPVDCFMQIYSQSSSSPPANFCCKWSQQRLWYRKQAKMPANLSSMISCLEPAIKIKILVKLELFLGCKDFQVLHLS